MTNDKPGATLARTVLGVLTAAAVVLASRRWDVLSVLVEYESTLRNFGVREGAARDNLCRGAGCLLLRGGVFPSRGDSLFAVVWLVIRFLAGVGAGESRHNGELDGHFLVQQVLFWRNG